MTKIKGNCVLITGGASGIGRIMGRMALEKGARCLVIWDINEENIASTIKEYNKIGKAIGYKVDVSDSKKVAEVAEMTTKECGNVDILINCAGIVANNNTFDKQSINDIERTMKINSIAPMVIARQFLPGMIERNHGHICNIASAAGMISNPRMSVYAASKWAAIGWSESMRIELQESKSGVRVTTVTPYYISTGMFDGVRSRVLPILKPERVARKILRAIERNKIMLGMPLGYHFIRICQAILPLRWFDVFAKMLGIYSTMDNFTGRKA